jgi:hypothetical protein
LDLLALEEGARLGVDARLGDRDPVQGAVELAVAAPVEAVPLACSRRCGQWRDARVAGELGVGPEAAGAGDLGDQLGGRERSAAGQLEQLGRLLAHARVELALERVQFTPERRAATHELAREPHPHRLLAA